LKKQLGVQPLNSPGNSNTASLPAPLIFSFVLKGRGPAGSGSELWPQCVLLITAFFLLCRTHSNDDAQAATRRLVRPSERVMSTLLGWDRDPRVSRHGAGHAL